MHIAHTPQAVAAATSTASALGLTVDDAVVLSESNRLVVRLTPCDVVARVVPIAQQASAAREVELARQLAATDSPIATLDARVEPRLFVRGGFGISMWTYVEPVASGPLSPTDYGRALERLHAGLRQIEVATPHVTDRLAAAQQSAASGDVTPDLADTDRAFLVDSLRNLGRSIVERRAPEQVLHGEPHPWNMLHTTHGPLFIDLEYAVHGPVEFDLAWVPEEVSDRHPDADHDLIDECRGAVLAIVTTHRWSHDDLHPSGRRSGVAFLDALREGPPWPAFDDVSW
jgi:Ser/Thr protein kinase RdoA (MazF antagonist)